MKLANNIRSNKNIRKRWLLNLTGEMMWNQIERIQFINDGKYEKSKIKYKNAT